jgi:hypothetical protein
MDLNHFKDFKTNCFTDEERNIIKQHIKIFSECEWGSNNLYTTHHYHPNKKANTNILFNRTILNDENWDEFYYPIFKTENLKFYDNFYKKLNDTESELYKKVYNYYKPRIDDMINNAEIFDIYRDFCRIRFVITPIRPKEAPKSSKFFYNTTIGETIRTYHPNLMKEYYILKDDGTYEIDGWDTLKENLKNIVKLYKINFTIENTPLTPKDIFRLYYEPSLKPLCKNDINEAVAYHLRIYGDTIDYACKNDEWLNEYKHYKALSNQKYRELSKIDDYWVF